MLYTSKPGNGIKWEVVFTSCGTQDKGSTQCILVGCMYVLNWNCSFLPLKNYHIYLKENCISQKNYNGLNQSITDAKMSIYYSQFKWNIPIIRGHYSWDTIVIPRTVSVSLWSKSLSDIVWPITISLCWFCFSKALKGLLGWK